MVAPSESLRRQFRLSAEDEAFLNGLALRWDTVKQAGQNWVIIYDLPIPPGYHQGVAAVAILIAPGYPPGPLDMAYFHPKLNLKSGRTIPNAAGEVDIDGQKWQAWSRHRTADNPWQVGEDNLGSHFLFMQAWLTDELKR